MKTRTLLLLAVGCGLAILVAGTVYLLGLANEERPDVHGVGEQVTVGDLSATVTGYVETRDVAIVSMQLGGVDDPDGAAPFELVVSGDVVQAISDGAAPCAATTPTEQACTLTFPLADAPAGVRALRYRRGDQTAVWELQASTGATVSSAPG